MKGMLLKGLLALSLTLGASPLPILGEEVKISQLGENSRFDLNLPQSAAITTFQGKNVLEGYFSVDDSTGSLGKAITGSDSGFTVTSKVWVPEDVLSEDSGEWENDPDYKYNMIASLGDSVMGLRIGTPVPSFVNVEGHIKDDTGWINVNEQFRQGGSFFNQWHEISLVYDKNQSLLKLLVDGEECERKTAGEILTEEMFPLSIGYDPSSETRHNELKFSNFRVFANPLSGDELLDAEIGKSKSPLLWLDFENQEYYKDLESYKGFSTPDVFEFGKDNLPFSNSPTSFYGTEEDIYDSEGNLIVPTMLDISYLNELRNGMSNRVQWVLSRELTPLSPWGGSCFGMGVTVVNSNRKQISPSKWDDRNISKTLYDFSVPFRNRKTQNLINFYQLSYNLPDVKNYQLDFSHQNKLYREETVSDADGKKIKLYKTSGNSDEIKETEKTMRYDPVFQTQRCLFPSGF